MNDRGSLTGNARALWLRTATAAKTSSSHVQQ